MSRRSSTQLAEIKLVSKYYPATSLPVANYSYPRKDDAPSFPMSAVTNHDCCRYQYQYQYQSPYQCSCDNGNATATGQLSSLGSHASTPGLMDDRADSDMSHDDDDDYEYHAHATELWDTFWRSGGDWLLEEDAKLEEDEEEQQQHQQHQQKEYEYQHDNQSPRYIPPFLSCMQETTPAPAHAVNVVDDRDDYASPSSPWPLPSPTVAAESRMMTSTSTTATAPHKTGAKYSAFPSIKPLPGWRSSLMSATCSSAAALPWSPPSSPRSIDMPTEATAAALSSRSEWWWRRRPATPVFPLLTPCPEEPATETSSPTATTTRVRDGGDQGRPKTAPGEMTASTTTTISSKPPLFFHGENHPAVYRQRELMNAALDVEETRAADMVVSRPAPDFSMRHQDRHHQTRLAQLCPPPPPMEEEPRSVFEEDDDSDCEESSPSSSLSSPSSSPSPSPPRSSTSSSSSSLSSLSSGFFRLHRRTGSDKSSKSSKVASWLMPMMMMSSRGSSRKGDGGGGGGGRRRAETTIPVMTTTAMVKIGSSCKEMQQEQQEQQESRRERKVDVLGLILGRRRSR